MKSQNDPVWDIILNRHAEGSKRGNRAPDDQAKVAIIMPGNGLGGSVNIGMISALEELGMMDGVDMIAGTSGGAVFTPFAALGQAREVAPLLWGPATDKKLLSLNRFIPYHIMKTIGLGRFFKPAMDLDLLFNDLLPQYAPLDEEELLDENAIEIYLTAMNGETHEGVVFSTEDFRAKDVSLKQAMRASATLPILSKPDPINGVEYYDGVYKDPVPIQTAIDHGATHILVLYPHDHTQDFRKSKTMQRLAFILGKKWSETFEVLPILQRKLHQTVVESDAFTQQGAHVSNIVSPVKTKVFDQRKFKGGIPGNPKYRRPTISPISITMGY